MINRVIITLFGINLYWYGLIYSVGFLLTYLGLYKTLLHLFKSEEDFDTFFFLFIVISMLGSRIFEILFYNPKYYFNNPIKMLYVWQGGLSIHGGLLFGYIFLIFFGKRFLKKDKQTLDSLFRITDAFSLFLSYFLAIGRIANYINQELVGIPAKKFCVVFPEYDTLCRYPVQLFDSLKNLIVFDFLYIINFGIFRSKEQNKENFMIKNNKIKPGTLTALFFILYNFGRFLVDFLKEPVVKLFFTFPFRFSLGLGQLFSLIYGFFGLGLLQYILTAKQRQNKTTTKELKIKL